MSGQTLLPGSISLGKFRQLLDQYDSLIETVSLAKPAKPGQRTLIELDQFRYDDAVDRFQSRDAKSQMRLEDVKILVDWKLRHGKFRPTLMKLVSSNDEGLVERTIKDAIESYWVDLDAAKALEKITKLRGIGPATASLLLSVHDPDRVVFFSDEAFYWLCCEAKRLPIKYNTKEYLELDSATHALIKRLGVKAIDIEKVAYVLIKEGMSETISADGKAASVPVVKPTQVGSTKKSTKRRNSNSGDSADKTDRQTPVRRSKHNLTVMAVDISSLLASDPIPLTERFAKVKRNLIAGNEKAVADSFCRLLGQLRKEADRIAAAGPDIIPTLDYFDINDPAKVAVFRDALQKRGVAVVRKVIPSNVALSWKEETQEYLRHNPLTKGIPASDPQMYELFWSPGQVKARADSRVLEVQRFVMNLWYSHNENALVSGNHPVAYADRMRIRKPGDTSLGSGPHMDGGSVERWEPDGYGRGGTYAKIFQGRWEEYDPWESSTRLGVTSDLYNGAGACSMFRMFQGWLSLSPIAPGLGSLRACPMLQLTTAYVLLRPFFSPRFRSGPDFLDEDNWHLHVAHNSVIQGAVPGRVQELTEALHPHLRLGETMVPIPRADPGDYVVWHPDTIHAADAAHRGATDAAVLYVPACPLTQTNALYLARQRRAFLLGHPAPDFESGHPGERDYLGRPGVQDVNDAGGDDGLRSMGLLPWDESAGGGGRKDRKKKEAVAAEKELLRQANGILFPDRFDLGYRRKDKRL
ncbi:DUF1479-domain-containing protein [Hypoxylon sp. FL1284]|nr:DUF1479-domain-containing protein [Hypoxylon sp. FL1284]